MIKFSLYIAFVFSVTAGFALAATINDNPSLFMGYVATILVFLGCIWRRDKR